MKNANENKSTSNIIPKRIVLHSTNSQTEQEENYCPYCNVFLTSTKFKYCPYCGKKIFFK